MAATASAASADEAPVPADRFPQAWDRSLVPHGGAAAEPLLEAVLRENRELREQKEVKSAELIKSLRAQQGLEKSYAEATAERQALDSEVKHLQQKVSEMDLTLADERRRREEVQKTAAALQQRLQEVETQQRQMELRFAEQKERLKDTEEKLRHAEARAAQAERAAKVSSDKAKETEQQCQVKAEKETMECRLKYAELGAARQREMQAALLELQSLARGQELLRAELSRALRPLPAKPMGSYLAPPLRPLPAAPPFAVPVASPGSAVTASPLRQAARSPSSFETMQRDWRSPPGEDLRRTHLSDRFEPVSRSFRSPEVTEPLHRDLSPGGLASAPQREQSCP
eukprot:s1400_g7.t1